MELRHVCLCGQEFEWRGPLVQHIRASGKVGHGVDVEVNRAVCEALYPKHGPAAKVVAAPQFHSKADGAPLYRGFGQ
jgi:hypothetical protein